jgi:glucuronate isomerase
VTKPTQLDSADAFITEDFLLSSEPARHLYLDCAAKEPICDYHCHIAAADVATDRKFTNLYELWLEGDHYKWRAMRANGVGEHYCTGDATPYEKFLAWARTVPYTLRNPLYHWTHLELRRYFGITALLDETTAPEIWARAVERLASGLTAQAILRKFDVASLCTTDDPADDLCHHRSLALSDLQTQVLPTFRPDKALCIDDRTTFAAWISRLGNASGLEVTNLGTLLSALSKRHDEFHRHGCRLSDHGLPHCYATPCSEKTAAEIFVKALGVSQISPEEQEQFASFMMLFFGHLDAEKGWTKQLHLGASRNVNTAAYRKIGPDAGFDAMGDYRQAESLTAYLDLLARQNALPQVVIYNSNPADTYLFATLIGSFQDGTTAGKIQYGSAWWFLDQRQGITSQINALSNVGLLSRFVGMVTDSRSFMSYPRHEYFRRILCDILGNDVVRGELPNDPSLLSRLVQDICYGNAKRYLRLPAPDALRESLRSKGQP